MSPFALRLGTVPQRVGKTASCDPIQISSAGGVVRTLEIDEWCWSTEGFAFAWFKIRNEDVGVYSLHLKE
jgi:hypothetical protein